MSSHYPLHILYLCFDDISAPKGPSVNEREFLNGLEGCGVPYTAVIPEPASRVAESGFQNVHTVSAVRSSRLYQTVFGQLSVLVAVISLLRRNRNMNYHAVIRLPALPWSVGLLALVFPNVPIHVKSLGDTDFLKRKGGLKGLLLAPVAILQSLLVRFALKRVRTIDTVTEKLADRIARTNRLDPAKIHTIPNTTNTNRFHPVANRGTQDRFVVGYFGGHPYIRGGRQIIQAVSRISDVMPGIRCRIAGGDVQKLEQVAREYRVQDRCDIVGKIPYDSVNDFINSLDLLLATDDGPRAKMFGNSNQKIRQALSVGIPVISNRHAEQDLVRNNLVHPVDTEDMEEVCNAISLQYHLDSSKREAFSKKSREFIRNNYSLEISTTRRLQIWTSESMGSSDQMTEGKDA
jgi:glycosyltransferase involved in cell wall biosynthesis